MKLIDSLTPKDTEELKPGLFIQKTKKGYKQINPIAWQGQYRWKEQFKTILSLRFFLTIVLTLIIAWSYTHDIKAYQNFYFEVKDNPVLFCENVFENLDKYSGLSNQTSILNIQNEKRDSDTIPNNIKTSG